MRYITQQPWEYNNTFLITTDSDYWPLNEKYLKMEKGKKLLITNPANFANCYSGIFSHSNEHGWMNRGLRRNQILAEMAERLKGKNVRLKRGAQKKLLVDGSLWENLTSPEKQIYEKPWQNKLNTGQNTYWQA